MPEKLPGVITSIKPLLDTDAKREAFRDFVRESGGWTREEIDAWSEQELNALCHQWIMGDVREAPALLPGITFREDSPGVWYHEDESTPDMETGPFDSRSEAYEDAIGGRGHRADSLEDIDWDQYGADSHAGQVSSRLWKDEAGQYWFSLNN